MMATEHSATFVFPCEGCENSSHITFVFIPDEGEWWGRCPICDITYVAEFLNNKRQFLTVFDESEIVNANSYWNFLES